MKKIFNIHNAILIIVAIGVSAGIFSGLLFLHFRAQHETPFDKTFVAGSLHIPIAIANTNQTRQQGLSDTVSLPADSGMVFVFDTPGNYGFWMKDMHYALDFVWINNAKKIVAITHDVGANTYPKVFYPPQNIQYVLEVNAGFSTAHNLKTGQEVSFLP